MERKSLEKHLKKYRKQKLATPNVNDSLVTGQKGQRAGLVKRQNKKKQINHNAN